VLLASRIRLISSPVRLKVGGNSDLGLAPAMTAFAIDSHDLSKRKMFMRRMDKVTVGSVRNETC